MKLPPWFLHIFGKWQSIADQCDRWAERNGHVPYSQEDQRYRFSGWGTVGFPPKLACNVLYFSDTGPIDLGRIVAK